MLTSLLRRFFAKPRPAQDRLPSCLPEWSEPIAEQHASIWWKVKPYTTMTVERVMALCQSVAYLENQRVPEPNPEAAVGKAEAADEIEGAEEGQAEDADRSDPSEHAAA